jgi:hypothetical protein
MNRATAYRSATDAIITSILADAGRLVTVDSSLTTNGEGFLITDPAFPTQLWDAAGVCWQSRVVCLAEDKFRLILEVL